MCNRNLPLHKLNSFATCAMHCAMRTVTRRPGQGRYSGDCVRTNCLSSSVRCVQVDINNKIFGERYNMQISKSWRWLFPAAAADWLGTHLTEKDNWASIVFFWNFYKYEEYGNSYFSGGRSSSIKAAAMITPAITLIDVVKPTAHNIWSNIIQISTAGCPFSDQLEWRPVLQSQMAESAGSIRPQWRTYRAVSLQFYRLLGTCPRI